MGEATVGGGTTIPQNGRYMSGIYAACLTYGLFKSVPNMDFACLQNIVAYGYEGAIGNTQQGGRMAAVCAHGYFLGKAGQSLYGPEYTATNNIANLAILAVKPSSGFEVVADMELGGEDRVVFDHADHLSKRQISHLKGRGD